MKIIKTNAKQLFFASALSALLLSGCAVRDRSPLSSGDITVNTPPTEISPVFDTSADSSSEAPEESSAETVVSDTETVSETLPENTEAPTVSEEETEELITTSDPKDFAFDSRSAELFATATLNVREYPSTEAKIVGQLNPGDSAEVIGRTYDGSWYVLIFNGVKACAYAEYLSPEKPVVPETQIALPEGYRFENDEDYYFLVNKQVFLPDDYSIETDYVQGSYELEAVAAKHCRDMIAAAKEDGIDLKVLSAYRTIDYQKNLFDRNVKQRMNDYGMSYDEAYYDVSINIAPPGGSEHNAGLAVDIIDYNHWDTYEEFENTEEFSWLIEHCAEYGFVLRYPKGKEDITGYIYEPWHYRYVGLENAQAVMDSGKCLEELLG